MSSDSHLISVTRAQYPRAHWLLAFAAFCGLLAASGCSRLREHTETQYVYVIAKQGILRDRFAAVSNRVGEVTNGEKLEVLEQGRRAIKVKTPEGVIGWIEEKAVASQALADQFDALRAQHAKDPVIASGTATDDVNLHILPGLDTDRFYRLSEGDSMSLLKRAVVPKPASPGAVVAAASNTAADGALPPPVMQDWWLVRGPHGQTGWVYSGLVEINVPPAVARYAEGQRIIGAYVLQTVDDPDARSPQSSTGKNHKPADTSPDETVNQPVTNIPEYVTAVSSLKHGLPYDFDEIRVFIWNMKKHRYETSFRERNIMGYLPVSLFKSKDPYGKTPDAQQLLPTFSYTVLAADAPLPVPDPKTGDIKPARLITKTYRLEGNICRRLLPPNTPSPDEAHPVPELKKEKPGKRKR
jgi:hypothetical protein